MTTLATPGAGAADAPRAERRAPGPLYDSGLVFLAGVLMVIGVAMAYSASVSIQGAEVGWRTWWNTPLRQAAFSAAGFFLMAAVAHADYRALAWEQRGDGWRSGALAGLALLLLIAVLIPGIGVVQMGAARAIYLPGVNLGFQPSEIAKVVLVIWLAAVLTRPAPTGARPMAVAGPGGSAWSISRAWGRPMTSGAGQAAARPPRAADSARRMAQASGSVDPGSWRYGFGPAVLIGGLLIGLTGLEDYGTAALMGATLVLLLYLAGARLSQLGLLGLVGLAGGAVLLIMRPHRVQRVLTFFADAPDVRGEGYQVAQSLIAIGSGGWFGRGLGAGVQKYGYLPQDNNDFVFAVVCEELGIVGGLLVIGLFLGILWRGWRIAVTAPDPFGRLLAFGLTFVICFQAAFNIAVVTNMVPTKGISLPFVSSGGSGVVFLGLATGLLASIGRGRTPAPRRDMT